MADLEFVVMKRSDVAALLAKAGSRSGGGAQSPIRAHLAAVAAGGPDAVGKLVFGDAKAQRNGAVVLHRTAKAAGQAVETRIVKVPATKGTGADGKPTEIPEHVDLYFWMKAAPPAGVPAATATPEPAKAPAAAAK